MILLLVDDRLMVGVIVVARVLDHFLISLVFVEFCLKVVAMGKTGIRFWSDMRAIFFEKFLLIFLITHLTEVCSSSMNERSVEVAPANGMVMWRLKVTGHMFRIIVRSIQVVLHALNSLETPQIIVGRQDLRAMHMSILDRL